MRKNRDFENEAVAQLLKLRQEIWGNHYHCKLDGELIISVATGLCKYGMLGPKMPF